MKKFNVFLTFILCLISIILFSGCSFSEETKNNIVEEKTLIELFMNNAKNNMDGTYSFSKYEDLGNVSFKYEFTYIGYNNTFYCSHLTTTKGKINLYNYASVSFSWNNFKKGSFYSYQEFIYKIEFEYFEIEFDEYYGLGEKYSYNILSNTYQNTNQENINEYASTNYKCLKQAVLYCKSILNEHKLSINLW